MQDWGSLLRRCPRRIQENSSTCRRRLDAMTWEPTQPQNGRNTSKEQKLTNKWIMAGRRNKRCVGIVPESANSGQGWPKLTKDLPMQAKFGRNWAHIWPETGPTFGEAWPNLGRVGPSSLET